MVVTCKKIIFLKRAFIGDDVLKVKHVPYNLECMLLSNYSFIHNRATDDSSLHLSSTGTLSVSITNVNEYSPVFNLTSYTHNLKEQSAGEYLLVNGFFHIHESYFLCTDLKI